MTGSAAALAWSRLRVLASALLVVAVLFSVPAVPRGSAQESECLDVDNGRCDLAIVSAAATIPSVDHVRVDVAVTNIGGTDSFRTTMTIDGGSEWPPFETTIGALPLVAARTSPPTS